MRRAFNGTLVSLVLLAAMFLSFGRTPGEDPPAATPVHRAAEIEAALAAPPYADVEVRPGLTSLGENPFAYIREDGSLVFLPVAIPADAPLQIEDALPRPTARG